MLKSRFVHKKHRVQYEMRTHFLTVVIKHLTGSTADTFVEYIQRVCPEGVAMKVTEVIIKLIMGLEFSISPPLNFMFPYQLT